MFGVQGYPPEAAAEQWRQALSLKGRKHDQRKCGNFAPR